MTVAVIFTCQFLFYYYKKYSYWCMLLLWPWFDVI